MTRLQSILRTLFWHWWLPPSLAALASLAGIVLIVVDPWCYLSGSMACYEFALDNVWGNWPHHGKWEGLQFFGTGFLGAAAAFSWPALRDQIVRHHGSRCGSWLVAALNICFRLGYFALLSGIAGGIYQKNQTLVESLSIYISAPLVVLMTIVGWVIIIHAIYIAVKKMWAKRTVLLTLWGYVLQVWRAFAQYFPW